MTGEDYEADLGNGEPFIDKLELIHFFNTIKQRPREHVIVFLNIVWGKTKLNGSIGSRMHRYKFTKKN